MQYERFVTQIKRSWNNRAHRLGVYSCPRGLARRGPVRL